MDHRGLHVIMAQKFLNGSAVVAAFEQVSCKECGNLWQVARFADPAFATASLTAF